MSHIFAKEEFNFSVIILPFQVLWPVVLLLFRFALYVP